MDRMSGSELIVILKESLLYSSGYDTGFKVAPTTRLRNDARVFLKQAQTQGCCLS